MRHFPVFPILFQHVRYEIPQLILYVPSTVTIAFYKERNEREIKYVLIPMVIDCLVGSHLDTLGGI